ncbi:MAG: hypothetical protein ACFFED_13515 [Candidatus Thorarchaeota archaeon]
MGNRRDIFKVLLLVPLAIISTYFALSGAGIVSLSYRTRLAVHSILAYWASISAVVLLINTQDRKSISRCFFLVAFLFYVFSKIDHALAFLILSQEVMAVGPKDHFVTLIELCLTGIFLLLGFLSGNRGFEIATRKQSWMFLSILLSVPVSLYGLAYFFIEPLLVVSVDGVLPVTLAAIICGSFLLQPIICWKRCDHFSLDRGYLTGASILISIASAITINAFLTNSDSWIFAENLLIAALFLYGITFGMPYLRKHSYTRLTRYLIIISLALTAYLPLLITTIIESVGLTDPFEVGNFLAYSIIHFGASILSAIMAILLFAYSRLKPSLIHFYLVLVFVVWSAVTLASTFSLFVFGTIVAGEPTVPYLIGGVLTLQLLYKVQKSLRGQNNEESSFFSFLNLFIYSIFYASAVYIGEVTNQLIIRIYPILQSGLLGNGLLLVCNYFVFIGYAYLLLLLANLSKGKPSFEMYVVGFLASWIVPITLKSFYDYFTPGWWVSEIFLFGSLLVGPSILVALYISAARDVGVSHMRARLYADLLMHDITNYNQMTLTTLELLSSKDHTSMDQERLLSDARTAVSLTEQLIENVRLMNESDNWAERPVQPTNLIATVVSALDIVTHSARRPDTLIRFRPSENRSFVMANELLFGAVLNLLYVALEIPSYRRELALSIDSEMNRGTPYWNVSIEIPFSMVDSDEFSKKIGPSPIGYIEATLGFQVARLIVQQIKGSLLTSQIQTDVDLIQVMISMILPSIENVI